MAPVRTLVAMVPDWPVVAAGYPQDVPAAVVAGSNRVLAVTTAARADGVHPGLRRREAQSRCPGLQLIPADPGRDARGWEPVVARVESLLLPAIEVLEPGALAFATRGPARYFGGDGALAAKVVEVVEGVVDVGAGVRVGIAEGLFTAGLAAAGGRGPVEVVTAGAGRVWLAPHPVGVLGPDFEDLADLLVRLGVLTLGALAALPAKAVLGRFGAAGAVAHRLARGLDGRAPLARKPPPDLTVTAELDPPEQRIEAAAFVAKALADELQEKLRSSGLGCTKVAIEVETEHGERLVRHWRHDGTLTASALADRARWQLEGWLAGVGGPTGGLTLLRLAPEQVGPDRDGQLGFWGSPADGDSRASRALARIQGILGPEAVVTAVLGAGRGYAEQVRLVPWGDARDGEGRRTPGREIPPWPGRLSSPAPSIVPVTPLVAEVRDAGGEAVGVSGRGELSAAPVEVALNGSGWLQVRAWAGPWPLEERWWDAGGRRRARFQVVLDDGSAHLLARERGRWWVEATYG